MTPAHIARRSVLRELDATAQAAARAGELPPDLTRPLSARPDELELSDRVEVVGGRLRYWTIDKGRPVTDRLLPDFVALADADEAAVCSFARTWGVFHFCRHGVPLWHQERCLFGSDAEAGKDGSYSEPIAAWLVWARRMDQVFRAIAALKAGRPVERFNPEFWWGASWLRTEPITPGRDWAWGSVANAINEWLALGRVAPMLQILNSGRPVVKLGDARIGERVSLLGALAIQMMLFAVSGRDLYVCGGCGQRFTLREGERRRNPNQAVWCEACRKKASDKIARQRYNARTPEERAQRARERAKRAKDRTKQAGKQRRKGAHRGRKPTRAR